MPMKPENVIGRVYGRLTVLSELPQGSGYQRRLRCRCECGNETRSYLQSLREGGTTSCGCAKRERAAKLKHRHGGAYSIEYCAWQLMKQRCSARPSNPNRKNYAERGIVVCERWRNDFPAFLSDVGPRPSTRHTLDRIDNNGPYSPENCRWVSRSVQLRNTRRTRLLTYNGETLCLSDWAARVGLSKNGLTRRLNVGWSVERALTTPAH